MEIKCEISLASFEWWSGARDNAMKFTYEEMDELECILDGLGEEWTDTQLNDLMWFEPEIICEWLGIDFDEWIERD